MSEQNLGNILDSIEELYRNHSRNGECLHYQIPFSKLTCLNLIYRCNIVSHFPHNQWHIGTRAPPRFVCRSSRSAHCQSAQNTGRRIRYVPSKSDDVTSFSFTFQRRTSSKMSYPPTKLITPPWKTMATKTRAKSVLISWCYSRSSTTSKSSRVF